MAAVALEYFVPAFHLLPPENAPSGELLLSAPLEFLTPGATKGDSDCY